MHPASGDDRTSEIIDRTDPPRGFLDTAWPLAALALLLLMLVRACVPATPAASAPAAPAPVHPSASTPVPR
jgi:hypothetical protein